ncbi:MAG: peptidylprolyl isomerase [Planctomycetales bacterium]|nr:peptidylprolyl isomerase [Planctomycetales bacterium]
MQRQLTTALICSLLATAMAGSAVAQTLRFETNVGSFDMLLNPSGDANLQPLVDNILAYVGLGRYNYSVINRAADNDNSDASDDFVLQMGSFLAFPGVTDHWADHLQDVTRLTEVIVDADGDGEVDFDRTALTNTRGTVSLALSAGGPNTGTSSFFINLSDDNTFLDDTGFVPFAEIVDMATIDRIMQLEQQNVASQFGLASSDLTFKDVPTVVGNHMVVIKDVDVIDAAADFSFVGPIQRALDAIAAENASQFSSSSSSSTSTGALHAGDSNSGTVPEPASLAMGISALGLLARRRR